MARSQLISLSRLWYTLVVLIVHLILVYFGIKQCYANDRLPWPNTSSSPTVELFIEKICLLTSLVLLGIFIYPSLFRIRNLANDEQQLTINDFPSQTRKSSLCSSLWHHCFALSSTLHLIMSFLIVISRVLIDGKQMMVGLKDSGEQSLHSITQSMFVLVIINIASVPRGIGERMHLSAVLAYLWRTDFDLLFDWSSNPLPLVATSKRSMPSNITLATLTFSVDSYSRLSLLNFLFASFVCILREPSVFWSISKIFSFIYSFALLLNVIQWCLMYGAFQLLLKNICFNPLESRHRIGYLLSAQPYTAFFLYLLLEFLIYISSLTFYYYAYNRFKYHEQKSSCYDRCSHYCPSLIALILLLLYTSCKMPLVHDLFLLYLQTRLQLLFVTFVFEIVHVLLLLALWIFLTTKLDWHLKPRRVSSVSTHGLTVKNTPIQPTAISLPELSGTCSSTAAEKVSRRLSDNLYQKPYEKIRIFQSEIYYRNRPKNWSLPLNQQAKMMATFDQDDEIVVRSPVNQEVQYRDAIRKTVSSLYHRPEKESPTPPVPPVKRFTKEQVEAARVRAQQLIVQRQRSPDYVRHHRSAALLISQV